MYINSFSCKIEGKFKLYTAIVLIHKSQKQSDTRSQLDITSSLPSSTHNQSVLEMVR